MPHQTRMGEPTLNVFKHQWKISNFSFLCGSKMKNGYCLKTILLPGIDFNNSLVLQLYPKGWIENDHIKFQLVCKRTINCQLKICILNKRNKAKFVQGTV